MKFEDAIEDFSGQPLTRQVLLNMLKEYRRPYDKIAELVQRKAIIPIKRGIYIAGPALKISAPEPILLANHLRGPSYVSMQTALSHWQLIPERVYEISSVTTSLSKIYDTTIGRFSYTHLELPYYSYGQQQITLAKNQVAIIANPEKSVCDTIIGTRGLLFRSSSNLREWLTEDMRIGKEALRTLRTSMMRDWLAYSPKKNSIELLIKTLENL
jgi:hypothetical protein